MQTSDLDSYNKLSLWLSLKSCLRPWCHGELFLQMARPKKSPKAGWGGFVPCHDGAAGWKEELGIGSLSECKSSNSSNQVAQMICRRSGKMREWVTEGPTPMPSTSGTKTPNDWWQGPLQTLNPEGTQKLSTSEKGERRGHTSTNSKEHWVTY